MAIALRHTSHVATLTDDAGADDGVDEVERRHRDGAALLLQLLLLKFAIFVVELGEMRRQVAVRRARRFRALGHRLDTQTQTQTHTHTYAPHNSR